MTDTAAREELEAPGPPTPAGGTGRGVGGWGVRLSVALACGLLGFVMVAQVRATEGVGDRLHVERPEDLAAILSELTAQSDRLQQEITELRLTLVGYETSAEREELARRSVQQRLEDLQVLTGALAAEGEGVVLTVEDPSGALGQEAFVDTIQELRDAGAEAMAIGEQRLGAASAFTTRNGRVLLDGRPLDARVRIVAIGPADTMATALTIPGGAIDSLRLHDGVTATVEPRAELMVPAAGSVPSFVFGEPVAPDGS